MQGIGSHKFYVGIYLGTLLLFSRNGNLAMRLIVIALAILCYALPCLSLLISLDAYLIPIVARIVSHITPRHHTRRYNIRDLRTYQRELLPRGS